MYQNLPQQINPYYQYNYQPQYSRPIQMEMQAQLPIQTQPQAQNYLKGRPVVSIEEARAAQIDLDGSLFVFTDIGNKKIYTKQLTIDGTPAFNTYELVNQNAQPQPPEYVMKSEFDAVVNELTQLRTAFTNLQEQINKTKASNVSIPTTNF